MFRIEPYDDEMGVAWRIVHAMTGEVLEDGFDSTADAEMYAHDEGIICLGGEE